MGKLTGRQSLFAKHYSMGKSGKKAAILAGYSAKSAEVIASENLRKPEILKKVEAILDKAGLSDEALARRLQKAIDSGLGKRASNADALKGIRIALELKDRFPDAHSRVEVNQKSEIELSLQGLSAEELEQYLEDTTIKTKEVLERITKRHQALKVKAEVNEAVVMSDEVQVPKAVGIPTRISP
ncbi:hypothetical protein A3A55_04525 [Candidatus Roizmanbacteria bacterium RIFCSPLOWO2_01_FULL_40_14]|uniref:Prophage LambdaCh01 n=1 Tax=Candidatus Roizmanbacteria bacterium GW2011_GWA1_41_13 TaxID=1618474 RepID=A0A0G0UXD3_9BACT|nr:MAG: Prophage LambdaCh01 [Candidatus Roizmanbacteria bacterium GW2011_GWA1_41_13]OGK50781.1 MAG: hypothetical protein A3A55_04525 [Candidatus Roizmanbacteria bacterium RIFCSPLOWO2_01_FULL_40_14]